MFLIFEVTEENLTAKFARKLLQIPVSFMNFVDKINTVSTSWLFKNNGAQTYVASDATKISHIMK